MRRKHVLVLAASLWIAVACGGRNSGLDASAPATVRDARGTVEQFPDAASYVIVTDGAIEQRFVPANLPPDFRRHGLRVVFSGNPGEIPAHVRMIGTPFVLTSIRVESER